MKRKARWRMAGLVVMLAMLCACAAPAEPTPAPLPDPIIAEQPPIPQGEVNLEETDELVVWSTNNALENAVDKFKEKYPEIKVEVHIFGDGDRSFQSYVAGTANLRSTPDVVCFNPLLFADWCDLEEISNMPQDVQQFLDTGVLLDLTPIIEQDETFDKSHYFEPILDAGNYRGGQYLIPFEVYFYCFLNANQDLLDEVGYKPENVLNAVSFLKELSRIHPELEKNENYKTMFMISSGLQLKSPIKEMLQLTNMEMIDYKEGIILPEEEQFRDYCAALKEFLYGETEAKIFETNYENYIE